MSANKIFQRNGAEFYIMCKRLVLLALLGGLIYGQSDTAALNGSVTDPTRGSVVGAKITLRNLSTASRRLTVTDVHSPVSPFNDFQGSQHWGAGLPLWWLVIGLFAMGGDE
jgi:hypothetical protein